jgi:uncharacterized protein (DUF1501 family)
LATRLQQIAQLIGAEFGPRIYYTSLGGFDTHARQGPTHAALLRELSDSIAAFFDDLKSRRLADRVQLLTFSEFGRRLQENGGLGTDHGAAAPVFLAGGGCKPGVTVWIAGWASSRRRSLVTTLSRADPRPGMARFDYPPSARSTIT